MITIKENVGFEGWPNCVHLSNRKIELIVTTDIGPRIIRLGYVEGSNMLYVSTADRDKVGGDQWRIYGGHRLWHSPEVMPRTYCPDNSPVNYSWDGKTLTLTSDVETLTGIGKEVEITLDPEFNQVTVLHRLVNHNLWDVELSAWAITACAAGRQGDTAARAVQGTLPSICYRHGRWFSGISPRWLILDGDGETSTYSCCKTLPSSPNRRSEYSTNRAVGCVLP